MRTTSIKTIYLNEQNLKDAIVQWLITQGEDDLASHLDKNFVNMEWTHNDAPEFCVSMDGEFNE